MNIVSLDEVTLLNHEGVTLIDSLSLKLSAGEILFIKGANGTGKTSLLHAILGHRSLSSGHIRLNIKKQDIAYLPQIQSDCFHIEVLLSDILDHKALEQIILDGVDLQNSWNSASGGERMKTLIARVLVQNSLLLCMDEPTNHLDKKAKALLASSIQEKMENSKDTAAIIISHDDEFVSLLDNTKTVCRHLEL